MRKKLICNALAILLAFSGVYQTAIVDTHASTIESLIDNNSGVTSFYLTLGHNAVTNTPMTLNPSVKPEGLDYSLDWKIKYDFNTNATISDDAFTAKNEGNAIITGTIQTSTGTYQKDFPVSVTNTQLITSASSYATSTSYTKGYVAVGYNGADYPITHNYSNGTSPVYNVMGYLEGGDEDCFYLGDAPSTTLAGNSSTKLTIYLKDGLPVGTYTTYFYLNSSQILTCTPAEITMYVRESTSTGSTSGNTSTDTTTDTDTNGTTSDTTTDTTTDDSEEDIEEEVEKEEEVEEEEVAEEEEETEEEEVVAPTTTTTTTATVSKPTISSTTALNESGIASNNTAMYGNTRNTTSTLVEATNGYIRVEYISGATVNIEEYNTDFELTGNRTIPVELSSFVSFHEGEKHYYFMFATTNESESSSQEVVRIVKYDKNWNRISQIALRDINTVGKVSFADMIEYGGNLLVHTHHTMYQSSDGLNHQANMRFTIDLDSMTLLNKGTGVSNVATGYVSHSFNQMIDVSSDGFLVTADHGDAYPRAFALCSWSQPNIVSPYPSSTASVLSFYGTTGDNTTNAQMGGLQVGSKSVLLAGASTPQTSMDATTKNVFVTATPKSSFSTSASTLEWITNYSGDAYANIPHLVEITEDKFILMWNEMSKTDKTQQALRYTTIDGSGNQVGNIQSATGLISGVEPIVNSAGNLVWYSTSLSAPPVFYELNYNTGVLDVYEPPVVVTPVVATDGSVSYSFAVETSSGSTNCSTLGASSWAVESIATAARNNILTDMADVTKNYQASITREQFCRLIMNCYDAVGGKRPTSTSSTFQDTTNQNVLHANALGIVNGMSDTVFAPNSLITREQLALMAQNAIGIFENTTPKNTSTQFLDKDSVSSWALNSVIYAEENGILYGDTYGNIFPKNNLTCEQAIAVVLRIFDNLKA